MWGKSHLWKPSEVSQEMLGGGTKGSGLAWREYGYRKDIFNDCGKMRVEIEPLGAEMSEWRDDRETRT